MARVLRCTNPFVDEFFSMMEKADRTDGGFTYVELHSMYTEFMAFFYPDKKVLGKESIRRKLVIDGIPYIDTHDRKKPYLLKPSQVLLEIEGVKRVVFEAKGVSLDTLKQVKKEVTKTDMKNCKTIYENSDRKFERSHYCSDVEGTFDKFMYDRDYHMVFDKSEWIKFSDLYRDYLKYCGESIYVPASSLAIKKYLRDATYKVIKLPESRNDSKNLYVNINRRENISTKSTTPSNKVVQIPLVQQPVDPPEIMNQPIPLTADLNGSVTLKHEFVLDPITTLTGDLAQKVNNSVREFIHKKASYDEDGVMYDTRKLYAAYLYYAKDKKYVTTYSFNAFRYVLSVIPAARLNSDYENNTEVSRIIPEFEYLARMQEKNKAGLIPMQVNNYEKRVTKALEGTMAIYDQLEADNAWNPVVVEEEEVVNEQPEEKVKKDFTDLHNKINNAFGGEPKAVKEVSTTIETKTVETKEEVDSKAMESVDSAMQNIEEQYAPILMKYKALEEIRQTIKEERAKVHEELKPVFDMIVSSALSKLESLDATTTSFHTEVDSIKGSLKNLTSFTKK